MADPVNGNEVEEELVDYEEEEAPEGDQAAKGEEGVKRGYVGLHTAGFKEFLLKPEILRAITKNAFEHPSEGNFLRSEVLLPVLHVSLFNSAESTCTAFAVQHQCIPSATMGSDVLCQAKSGMGKTAVFVLSILQQIKVEFDETTKIAKVGALVMAHTRELAFQVRLQSLSFFGPAEVHKFLHILLLRLIFPILRLQISSEFNRFNESMAEKPRVAIFYGGVNESEDIKTLKSTDNSPHIVVGTPGRIKAVCDAVVCYFTRQVSTSSQGVTDNILFILQLVQKKHLKLASVRHFVLDECDKMLESVGKRHKMSPDMLDCKSITSSCSTYSLQSMTFGLAHADMRQDVQEIFKATPHDKQVMMFSATLSDQVRPVCKRFMDNVSYSAGARAA